MRPWLPENYDSRFSKDVAVSYNFCCFNHQRIHYSLIFAKALIIIKGNINR